MTAMLASEIMITRREALKLAALSIPGVALSDVRTLSDPAPLGVAILGLGKYAQGWIAPAIAKSRYMKLTGIITGSPEKVPEWQEKYSIPDTGVYNYEALEEIAQNDQINVVYVITPPGTHAEFTIRALEAGKHVICEKPMAVSTEECDAMIAAAKKNNRVLQIGYRLYWDPFNVRVMTALREKEFGAAWSKLDTRISFNIEKLDPNHWMLQKKYCLGGALSEIGVYAVQGAFYSGQELPVAVTAKSWSDRPELFADVGGEHWEWELEWSGGRKSSHLASFGREKCVELRMTLPEGELLLTDAYSYTGQKLVTPNGEENFTHIFQQQRQIDGQALAIMGRHPNLTPGEMGRRDIYVLEKVMEASVCEERIPLDGFVY